MVALWRVGSLHRIFSGKSGIGMHHRRHTIGIADVQVGLALPMAVRRTNLLHRAFGWLPDIDAQFYLDNLRWILGMCGASLLWYIALYHYYRHTICQTTFQVGCSVFSSVQQRCHPRLIRDSGISTNPTINSILYSKTF